MADKPVIRTIDLPFQSGLSQKEEARWQGPGGAQVAQNVSQNKSKSLGKRQGRAALSVAGRQAIASNALNIQGVKRLSAFGSTLVAVGPDAYTDAIWVYDDVAAAPILYDRVPEVYGFPVKPLVSSDMQMLEATSVVSSGYRLTVFLCDPVAAGSLHVFYMVTDAVTGAVVQQAQSLDSSSSFVHPSLVLCGTVAVLVYQTNPAGTINARTMTMSAPWNGFTVAVQINGTTSTSLAYAVGPITGDTAKIALFYKIGSIAGGGAHLRMGTVSVSSLGAGTEISVTDAQYVSDTTPEITGFCVRGETTVAQFGGYAYNASGTTRVKAVALTYNGSDVLTGATYMSAVEMDPGVTYPSPKLLDVKAAGTVNGTSHSQQYAWSGADEILGDITNSGVGIRTAIVNAPGGTGTLMANQPRITYGACLASEQLLITAIGGLTFSYMLGLIPSTKQGTYALFSQDSWQDITTSSAYPMRLVAIVGPRQAIWSGDTQGHGYDGLRTLPLFTLNASVPGLVFESTIAVNQSAYIVSPATAAFDFASTLNYASSQIGKNLVFSGGVPWGFDGQRPFELGFPYYPEMVNLNGAITVSNTGGAMTTGTNGGIVNYIAIYESRDNQGQVHRSARGTVTTANTQTVANGTSGSIQVIVPTMGFSWRQRPVSAVGGLIIPNQPNIAIKLYRTVTGGSVYYLCDTTAMGSDTVTSASISKPNSLSVASITLTDTVSDGQLVSHPLLYNDGGDGTQPGNILDNLCGPAFQHLVVHQNRIWGVDGNNIWISKAFTTGEGSGFNEQVAFSVDDGPGYITALASMDDKLIVFKDDRCFYMSGQGPADSGLDNDLTPPIRIPSDVGCINWRSLVPWQKGVWFQSRNGLYLLTRDLQVQAAGKFVEDILSTYPVITSGAVNTPAGEIVWTANTDDVSTPRVGILIRYNYVFDLWTTSQLQDASGNPVGGATGVMSMAASQSAGVWTIAPAHHVGAANGVIYRESQSTWLDVGNFVPSTWESPWLKSADLQGWGFWDTITLLFQSKDPADLNVQIASDYSTTFTPVKAITADKIAAFTTPLGQAQFRPPNANAQAIKIRISDAMSELVAPVTGQGLLLIGLRVDYGTYSSGYPVPPAQRAA